MERAPSDEIAIERVRLPQVADPRQAARAAGASELAEVRMRLLAATERVFTDSIGDAAEGEDPETVPMQGHRVGELHIRMGVLSEAERTYRGLLRDDPDDERARTMLADVIALRRALGEEPEPMPPRNASVSFLKKNAPRASSGQRWSSGRDAGWGAAQQEEDSTAALDASQEAELLLKLGRAEQALDVYRILAIRHPKQQVYRKRIAEIEALIAQRMTPISGEVTVRQSLPSVPEQAPTKPRLVLPDFPTLGDDDEDLPTMVDRLVRGDPE